MLQEMQTNFSTQLSESLAFKTSNICRACTTSPALKRDIETVVESRKLDYELLRSVDQVHGEAHRQVQVQRALAGHDEAARGCAGGWRRAAAWLASGGGTPGAAATARAFAGAGMGRRGGGAGGGGQSRKSKKLADEFQDKWSA